MEAKFAQYSDMYKRLSVILSLILLALATFAQQQTEESGSSSVKLDDDSLYYDDFAYLDEYSLTDNVFVALQVGTSHSMSENTRFGKFFDNQRISFNAAIGKWFYPAFGVRLTAGFHPQVGRAGWELAEAYPKYFGNYNFNIFSCYFDGMLNFSNVIFKYRESRKFCLIGIAGIGHNHSFGFDKDKCLTMSRGITYVGGGKVVPGTDESPGTMHYDIDPTPRSYLAAHVGLQGCWMVNDAFDVAAEITFNGTDDRYNGHTYDRVYDTYVDVLFSLHYHFLDSHGRHRFHYVKNLDASVLDRLKRMQDDENERLSEANLSIPEVFENLKFNEALQTTISFYVDRYYITDAQKKNVKSVAVFLQMHPDINLVVTGYADIETAYPAYNLRLSQKRAKAVYDMLVNEFHVPKERLRLDYKGDSVQPFATVNEWNRAVIFFLDKGETNSQVLESDTNQ